MNKKKIHFGCKPFIPELFFVGIPKQSYNLKIKFYFTLNKTMLHNSKMIKF
jgi:hypothetical protein